MADRFIGVLSGVAALLFIGLFGWRIEATLYAAARLIGRLAGEAFRWVL